MKVRLVVTCEQEMADEIVGAIYEAHRPFAPGPARMTAAGKALPVFEVVETPDTTPVPEP